jgi:integrase|tara:strand:+ start:101 stop:1450 length:1350 start_codon:yes stop_codon:yes gene_type:complete
MTSATSTSWEKELRKNICTNFGRGIRVNGENSGRTKILYVYNEGLGSANKRTSQTLPIEWKKTSGIEILKAIEFIKPLVVEKNLTLKEATRRWKAQFIGEAQKQPNKSWNDFLLIRPINKKDANYEKDLKEYLNAASKVDQFMQTKQGLTSKTEKDWARRISRFLEEMNNNPSPNTGVELIKKLSDKYLTEIEPDERKRYINAWCEILKYGIERHSQNEKRWQPPNETYRKELIGKSNRTKQDKLTPYIEENDLHRLLDDLESRDSSLFLAVGLISIFGLRLSELAVLRVLDGKLYVGNIKNNINTKAKKEDRRVFPMDLFTRKNLGKKLIELYESKKIPLPKPVLNQIEMVKDKNRYGDVGQALRQRIERNKVWKEIIKTNPEITPYSLRHRYAHQCHKGSTIPISVKDAAAAMGHSVETHNSFYGSYTTELSLEKAFERHLENRIEV